jgi:hypothetical protein
VVQLLCCLCVLNQLIHVVCTSLSPPFLCLSLMLLSHSPPTNSRYARKLSPASLTVVSRRSMLFHSSRCLFDALFPLFPSSRLSSIRMSLQSSFQKRRGGTENLASPSSSFNIVRSGVERSNHFFLPRLPAQFLPLFSHRYLSCPVERRGERRQLSLLFPTCDFLSHPGMGGRKPPTEVEEN